MFLDRPDEARYKSYSGSRFKTFIRKSALFVTGSSPKCYTSHVVRQKRKLKIVTFSFQACLELSVLPSGRLQQSYRFLKGVFLGLPQSWF